MAASVQSQPPKPPPPPPKVEAAPTAAPKPAAEAKPTAQASPAPAPRPAQTPDLFEQASGGGRALPTNGGSSFSPAVGAAQNQMGSTVRSAVSGVQSDLQSALGSVNDAARQNGMTGFQMGQDPAGFGGFSDQPWGDMNQFGGMGNLTGGGPGRTDVPSVFLSTGGAAGGVGDRNPTLNLSDTFSRNFGNPNDFGGFFDNSGGGSKPGIGGGIDYLNLTGGGGMPSFTTTPQPAISTQTSSNDSSRNPFGFNFDFGFGNNGHHLGLFNFGSARGGGGGAAGGVADRSGW